MPRRPTLYVCEGEDCVGAARKRLVEAARPHAELVAVRCQKVCAGPVCGVEVDGTLEWFAEVEGDKALAALVALLEGAPPGKPLLKRRARKRRGKLRE